MDIIGALRIIIIIFLVLFLGYIAVRLWSRAFFKSKIESKQFNDKKEG